MKTKIFQSIGILVLAGILIQCTKKKEDSTPKDIISWMKPVVPGNKPGGLSTLTMKTDNGFLVSGYALRPDTAVAEGFVTNMDSKGDTIWCKKIRIDNYTFNDVYYAVQKSSEEILIAGICSNAGKDRQRFIAWMDSNGNLKKRILFPVPSGYEVDDCKLFLLNDGSIYFASMIADQKYYSISNASILKIDLLDANGNLIRTKEFTEVHTFLDRLSLLDDGTMLMAGTTLGTYPNYSDMLFLLIDESGNEIYRRAFGSDSYDIGYSAFKAHNGEYLVSGMVTYSSVSAIYIISSSGVIGSSFSVADTIYSSATELKEASGGGYNLFIQSATRFYFMKMGTDLKVKKTQWFDNQYSKNMAPWPVREIFQLSDGSFAFLYFNDVDGQVLLKTVPLN